MNPALAQRELALAAVALLAVVLALALTPLVRGSDDGDPTPTAIGDWYDALAGSYRLDPATRQTACGYPSTQATLGVAHPVLPCGAKIVIEYDEQRVVTQVVDRGTGVPGRAFDLTAPLARRLGFPARGVQPIRWAFAG